MTEVRQLFTDVQPPGPAESDVNSNFIEMARSIAAICATRALLMVAVATGAIIWIWATWQPTDERLHVAIAFSLVFVLPQVALFWKRG